MAQLMQVTINDETFQFGILYEDWLMQDDETVAKSILRELRSTTRLSEVDLKLLNALEGALSQSGEICLARYW